MSLSYFKTLEDLLALERKEDLRNYSALTAGTSAADRRSLGLTWYPIAIRNTEIGRGEYLTLEVERTTHHDLSHQFRFGAAVAIFSNHQPDSDKVEGVISHLSGNKMKVSLRIDELPEWAQDGKLGVDLLFDNNSYDEMQGALKSAALITDKEAQHQLIEILTGKEKPTFTAGAGNDTSNKLNHAQNEAVSKILTSDHLAIVHGPPGTGKTTTLIQAISLLAQQYDDKILVVAPSNTAVDLLTEKLSVAGLNVIRVGNPARVSAQLSSTTLSHQMADHPEMKSIKQLKKKASEYKNMAHKYKRSFGKAERDQRKALFAEAHKIGKEIEKIESYIIDNLFEKAQIISATLVGANHYTVRNLKYSAVFIDEAGQAMEPACWIPILKASKVVLAGDHFQLPPTLKCVEAANKGLENTLMEKLVAIHPEAVTLLTEQYRMNEQIMLYPSRAFYADKLQAHSSVSKQLIYKDEDALTFIDTAGCSYDEKLDGTSTTNPDEANFLILHLSILVTKLLNHNSVENFPTIAVISPYKQQVVILKELLSANDLLSKLEHKIAINTIDSFQGQERDVVYISLTRSNTTHTIGFLSDTRRMNVAMTRAKKKLVVIGDSATLAKHKFYSDFIDHAEKNNAYRSAWEFLAVYSL
ncbi:IGHMBP2 family helicase [Pedobacter sandarakinus]|uniref:IGHMBP2 family helicase n=1 Tax=Pedobacter sandarakinus TaxID=353156 RepID=UPI002246C5FF|nr:IGHMBP2 family helicase [Pedobacter sandarakinus]MCX2574386.1 IGHMBP2 family helicase [Pedobacter sandarakinus]